MEKREMVFKLFVQTDNLSLEKCNDIITILQKEGMLPPPSSKATLGNWDGQEVKTDSKNLRVHKGV